MKNAVIYARFSCSNQTEQSIEGQLRVCKDYAARNHIEIVKEFIDRAKSGTNANRPSFQEMIKYCEAEHLDYVLVYKLDRFSRDKYDSAVYKRILRQHGIKVISATETLSDNPESILFESILEGFAQYYSVELAQKVRRGLRECYLKGYCVGGNTPLFGYRIENRKYFIDEEEAKVINEIFHQYSLGIKVTDIIDDLKKRQVVTKAKASFTDSKIYQML